MTVHRSPVHRTTGDTGGTVGTVTPVYIVGWYGGYGVLPPLHSYKSGMQRDDGTPYPPYYPAMYTGVTVPPVHRTTGATALPVTGGPVLHRHRCIPNSMYYTIFIIYFFSEEKITYCMMNWSKISGHLVLILMKIQFIIFVFIVQI